MNGVFGTGVLMHLVDGGLGQARIAQPTSEFNSKEHEAARQALLGPFEIG